MASSQDENDSPQSNEKNFAVMSGPSLSQLLPSTHKPSSIVSGTKTGLSNIILSSLGAVAVVLGAPIKCTMDGYKAYGIVGGGAGLILGTIAGAVGAGIVVLGGTLSGVYQITTGLVRTPAAVVNSSLGKEWDHDLQEWKFYDLVKDSNNVMSISDEQFTASLERGETIASILLAGEEGLNNSNKIKNDNGSSAADASTEPSASSPNTARPRKAVSDRQLYDLLGIEPEATSSEIKKAYYVKARQCHPDRQKHHGDPALDAKAKAQFQQIGEAYQVLSDDRLRMIYDQRGKESVDGAPKLDAGSLYAMIFGSENFETIIGELQLASQLKSMSEVPSERQMSSSPELTAFRQRKREVQLALHLTKKMESYIENDEATFLERNRKEAEELSESALGGALLSLVGHVYIDNARSELSTFNSVLISLKQSGNAIADAFWTIGESLQAARGASALSKIQQQSEERQKAAAEKDGDSISGSKDKTQDKETPHTNMIPKLGPDSTEEEKLKYKATMKDTATHTLGLMWQLTKMDITTTLNNVCNKVLRDHSVGSETRQKRCKALLLIGQEYGARAKSSQAGIEDLLGRLGIYSPDFEGFNSAPQNETNNEENFNVGSNSNSNNSTGSSIDNVSARAAVVLEALTCGKALTVKDLRVYIAEFGGSHCHYIEKEELVMALKHLLVPHLSEEDLRAAVRRNIVNDEDLEKTVAECDKGILIEIFLNKLT